ncbi:MAG: NDP-hexose 2,3-dehydratase family protein [Streptosporangiaceae bacterium]|nr:NDP-hexose 2,3-dehydratase family protein [Streptosporangiaceae bacterium]
MAIKVSHRSGREQYADIAALTGLRENGALAARIARSAVTIKGEMPNMDDIFEWLERCRGETFMEVDRIPFRELDAWSFDGRSGNLAHISGQFFQVEGLHVSSGGMYSAEWYQPIMCQLEIGLLGILVREFGGVLHFLMQAKMEPGNPNLLQLSPTVQATRSNYTKVHRGKPVRYLDYFMRPGRGSVLSDVLQSEHGSWFYRKRNRNMIIEVADDVPAHDQFRWLTLGQIGELLREDNVVNMDTRSVLAGLPGRSAPRARCSDTDLLSWIASMRCGNVVRADRVPLAAALGWIRGTSAIEHEQGRYFRVVAVSVKAGNREVAQWKQPMFEPCGPGVVAFLTRDIEGVPHVLARARLEAGFRDTVELSPTVQCTPGNYAHLSAADRPAFLDLVSSPAPSRVQYSALHSEEGGRFLNAVSRYSLIDTDESQAPLDPPDGFQWVSHGQLTALAQHSHYVNVQARTLLACLNMLTAAGAAV